jgi:putative endonuclease
MSPQTVRQQTGRRAEALARALLLASGYRIEAVNARFPVGEIDIIARDGAVLCFVEVRARRSSDYGGPLDTVDARKRRRLIQAARWHLARLRALPPETRFDVIAITGALDGHPCLELIRGAFDADEVAF